LWLAPERTEGWWNTFAMVVAYFSLFEHTLVGCLAFAEFDPGKETVTNFISSNWSDKFRRIFDLNGDSEASRKFNSLRSVADSYRNTYGHGGFDKAGSTVAFQIPGIGAVPATLSNIRNTPQADFVPAVEEDFEAICQTFDELGSWLANGKLKNALKWIKGGLDYRFDAQFRRLIETFESDFDEFVDVMAHRVDVAVNMDWCWSDFL
jgi:hypothetical protein